MQVLAVLDNVYKQSAEVKSVVQSINRAYANFIVSKELNKMYGGRVQQYYDIVIEEHIDKDSSKIYAVNKYTNEKLECLAEIKVYEKSFTVQSKYLIENETVNNHSGNSFIVCLN